MFFASSNPRAALTLALCTAALLTAAPVFAGEPREVRVTVDRLDLTAPEDIAVLKARVIQAARAVCRRPSHTSERVLNQRACVADTVRRALAQIDGTEALEWSEAAHGAVLQAR